MMWIVFLIFLLLRCGSFRYRVAAQPLEDLLRSMDAAEAPSIVVNLTLQSEDGAYVDTRQITVTISPPVDYMTAVTSTLTSADPNAVLVPSQFWTWTTFTAWSSCSATCGWGVQSAERFCVLVSGLHVVQAATTVDPCLEQDVYHSNLITTSVTTGASGAGLSSHKQYRRCEMPPCHSPPSRYIPRGTHHDNALDEFPMPPEGDARFQLCAEFDEKEFSEGMKYSWIPFQTVHAPCALLCRPSTERFYVSFANQVPDGLSCERLPDASDARFDGTLDGSSLTSISGVCLNGSCQAIGCDGIIGSGKRVDACGVCQGDGSNCQKIKIEFTEDNLPRGHNKIGTIPRGACNITLTEQRPSGNVFALRTTQGFFLNGEWTASPTGQYGAAGTVFNYQHVTNGNSLRRHGERVTAKGPLTSDIDIILVTKTRNVGVTLEYTISNDRSNIPSRRHRADNYIDVPNSAAEVHRGDIPSIAEDFVETPLRVEALATTTQRPADRFRWTVAGYTACSRTCGKGVKHSTIACMLEGPERRIVDDRYCASVVRPATFQEQCNLAPCAGEWAYGEWSECSVTCGTGTETREVRCRQAQSDGVMADVSDDVCGTKPTHGIIRACQRPACNSYSWRSGQWSPCDATCGRGSQQRMVKCYDNTYGMEVSDEHCQGAKPEETQTCEGGSCRGTWLMSDWAPKCSNGCGKGETTRHVVCYKDGRQQDARKCDATQRPQTRQSCQSQKDCGGRWYEGPWSDCSADCGVGSQTRDVICLRARDYERGHNPQCEVLNDSECKYHPKPETQRQCQSPACHGGSWYMSDWSPCSHSCGVGARSRQVTCLDQNKNPSNDCPENTKPTSMESCGNEICTQDDYYPRRAQSSQPSSFIPRTPVDLNNKAGTLYDAAPQADYRRPIDLNNKAGTLYDAAPQADYRGPIDLNNKAGTLYDAAPQQDYRGPIDLNNKAGTLYDAAPQADYRPPIDLNNKAGTLYDAAPQQDYRGPIDLNNKAGTLYDAAPQQDYRPPIDLNNKAGTLYDAAPQADYRPPIDLNNKAGTLYDTAPQQDYRPPIDLNNKAGTLYDAAPQQDYRPPIDLNNKAGTLYDAAPQQDYRPPIDLNNKAGTLYDAAPQADYRPPIDLNNKAGTLYDAAPQQDYRPPIDLNNKAGTLYDAAPQQDYRPPIDLNNKAGTMYDAAPQDDYRGPIDLNNKAGTMYDTQAPSRRNGDAGRRTAQSHAGPMPPGGSKRRAVVSPSGMVDIDVTPRRSRKRTETPKENTVMDHAESGTNKRNGKHGKNGNGNGHGKTCTDRMDRCKAVKELAFCRYDYYKKMCCKSCST